MDFDGDTPIDDAALLNLCGWIFSLFYSQQLQLKILDFVF